MMEEENRKLLEYARQQQQNEAARMEQKRLKEEAMDTVYKKVPFSELSQIHVVVMYFEKGDIDV